MVTELLLWSSILLGVLLLPITSVSDFCRSDNCGILDDNDDDSSTTGDNLLSISPSSSGSLATRVSAAGLISGESSFIITTSAGLLGLVFFDDLDLLLGDFDLDFFFFFDFFDERDDNNDGELFLSFFVDFDLDGERDLDLFRVDEIGDLFLDDLGDLDLSLLLLFGTDGDLDLVLEYLGDLDLSLLLIGLAGLGTPHRTGDLESVLLILL